MKNGRRVAVTGVGVVAPCGTGRDAYWKGLNSPQTSGERRIPDFDPLTAFDNPKEVRRTDRYTQIALAAAKEALEQSGDPSAVPERSGVLIGTGVGGLISVEEQVAVRLEKGSRRVSPFLVPMMMANAGSAALSMRYGFT